jgi:hypothetical protein|tara:strand:- start:62 stop:529 length:468 start_codon:yes stop_codon:yes gene_type:complete
MTQLKKITPRHERMIESLVLEGISQKAVCEKFGMSETRLSTLRKTDLWRKEEQKLSHDLRTRSLHQLQALVPKAIMALEETVGRKVELEKGILISNDAKARISSAKEILNRSGIRGDEDKGSENVTIQLYAPPYATDDGVGKIIDIEVGCKTNKP